MSLGVFYLAGGLPSRMQLIAGFLTSDAAGEERLRSVTPARQDYG